MGPEIFRLSVPDPMFAIFLLSGSFAQLSSK